MSLVTCARVGDALTKWLDTAAQQKKDALCAALGCGGGGGGGMTDEEIAAVFMNCDGVAHIPGAAIPTCDEMQAAIDEAIENIFTGGTAGQVWTKRADGTQGWEDGMSSVITADTNTVNFSGSGSAVDPLSADVIVNPDADNRIEETASGLKVSPELPAGGAAGQALTSDASGNPVWAAPAVQPVITEDSASVAITGDGSAVDPLTASVLVNGDPANRISVTPAGLMAASEIPAGGAAGQALTSDASGNPVWADPAVQPVITEDTDSVALTGDGTTGNPLSADVIVSPDADNRIEETPTGLKVSPELPAGGAAGQALTSDASGNPVWAAPAVQPVITEDSASVAITGDGSAADPLTADVIVSPDADNRIEETPSGLKVSPEIPAGGAAGQSLTSDASGNPVWADPAAQLVNTADSASISLTGDGSAANPLTATTSVSIAPDNALVVESPGGLFSHTTNLSWDNVAKTITYVNNKGAVVTIDLSQFEVELIVDNATFDPATTLLTLGIAGGTPVQVDLGALAAISTDSTATATLIGDGTVATPLQVMVNLDPAANNRLTASATGLLVSPELPAGGTDGQVLTTDAAGNATWATPASGGMAAVATTDTPTIDFSGDGTAATPVTGDVKLATGGVNRITAEATGLRVTAELPAYTAADNGKKLVIVAGEPEWQEDEPCLVQTRAGTGTLGEDDLGKLVLGTGGTITAPASLPIGFRVDLVGEVTVAVTGGTLRSVDGNAKVVANGGATLIKTSATEFWLAGALEA